MPEYLAPGVYVEEIDTGSKPIEGVSTSTAGMVGVTERGPVGVPILTTSVGEYERMFGGRLRVEDFGEHRHLPFAVEGFFTNGGKRLFVVRVLDTAGATRASFPLHWLGDGGPETALLRAASAGAGSAADRLFVLDGGTLTVSATQPFRIGDGSGAEYRFVSAIRPATESTHVPLHLPITGTYPAGRAVQHINEVTHALPSGTDLTLHAAVAQGADQVIVDATSAGDVDPATASSLRAGDLVRICSDDGGEYRFVRAVTVDPVTTTRATVDLDQPLALPHPAGKVRRLDPSPSGADLVDSDTLGAPARAGDAVVFVVDRNGNFDDPGDLLAIRDAANLHTVEVRRIGALTAITLTRAAGDVMPAGGTVEGVTMADTGAARTLTRAAAAGSLAITLDNRGGLSAGDTIRIGAGASATYIQVAALPDRALGGADPGTATLAQPLRVAYATGTAVREQAVTRTAGRPIGSILFDTAADVRRIAVTEATGYAAGDVIRLTGATGAVRYATLSDAADALDPRFVEVSVPITAAQPAGASMVQRDALLLVEALDAGSWGNRVRISVENEELGLLARTALDTVVSARQVRLGTYGGVEAGTVLELQDPATGATVDAFLKVVDVNRVNGTITLDADLTPAHLNAIAALPPGERLQVRSREFRMTVRVYRAPDPAVPTRSEVVLDTESYRYLSMDPRHSRYVETVIGAVDGPPRRSDGRPAGASRYIRVDDAAGTDEATLHSVRLGPETLVDVLPSGRTRAARHPLSGGSDSLGTLTDDTYVGDDSVEPALRTGLHSLRNIDDVSIVAIPGRLSVRVQGALIEHCELMHYRFAVLDGPRPPNDSLNDVQDQRQQFDTKYAALYHPWPLIREPFPVRLTDAPLLPIPPSGHVIGVYARTDIERGVHKAPANEVLRGVESLSRLLTKPEQDLLNPSPKNINVIRDFRADNRGIRIWGARVITSDPDMDYVNVRRLLIFIEKSVDQGLQWVVFEPNAEALWARVRQSIRNFLTIVWRNGALEGTKVDQAFFVKCDRTTMTQTDIDSGRLIVLVGIAPVKPAEFVIVRIGLKTVEADS